MNVAIFAFCIFAAILEPCASVIISRCDLAKGLLDRGIPRHQLNDWVCMAEGESGRNTRAIGSMNSDGSKDYGIFQINSKYWCQGEKSIANICGLQCTELLTDLLDPSTACAKIVYSRHGFNAWYAWSTKCKYKDLRFYTAGCYFDEDMKNIVPPIWDAPINFTTDTEDKFYTQFITTFDSLPPEYELYSFQRSSYNCTTAISSTIWICYKYEFVFKRIVLPHVLLVFLPSALLVIISWISFWLDIGMGAPRVALGLTSLLTLSTQLNAAEAKLPAVATMKALDIWMFVCIFMVFSSLLVFGFSYACAEIKKEEENNIANQNRLPQQKRKTLRQLAYSVSLVSLQIS
uniref:lysozyme n=1 Tax=Strigamia maritima TaxID=126957 RepID=T1J024_STRMM